MLRVENLFRKIEENKFIKIAKTRITLYIYIYISYVVI